MVEFRKSTTKGKKYDALYKGEWIPFGAIGYEHYKDSTGLGIYSNLDHNDKGRREAYRKRHGAIKTKEGKLAYKDPGQPAYYSWRYLW